jgi:hypothetical protein
MYVNVTMEHFREDEEGKMVPDTEKENQREVFEKVFLAKVRSLPRGWCWRTVGRGWWT